MTVIIVILTTTTTTILTSTINYSEIFYFILLIKKHIWKKQFLKNKTNRPKMLRTLLYMFQIKMLFEIQNKIKTIIN
jgi:branched-subunit amino acid transport protein AzlD